MKSVDFSKVMFKSGYWLEKEELNRKITINAVYERFDSSGRLKAFDCDWREGEKNCPDIFWDSDVAKWMEGAAYILAHYPDKKLEERLDSLIEKIRINQRADGYFNIHFMAVEPAKRFYNRDWHELYCAGHLMEAAIACDSIGKPVLLECMEKYSDYIHRVFVKEKSSCFASSGHEEIELALIRMYRHTGMKKYLDLAKHFIDIRGTDEDYNLNPGYRKDYMQAHMPVREQKEAVGHAVRALYLYTGMAMLAKETEDTELFSACKALFENIVNQKMYITGGVGSTHIGEAFTNAYDLPNDTAYAETCASIALMLFSRAMLENETDSRYADIIERAFYNGVLSGISLDGKRFFYENALEINLNEHFENAFGSPRYPITQRPEIFGCSCCPPNLNRLLSSLGGYIFGLEDNTLFINQYASSEFEENGVYCSVKTDYPVSGKIIVEAKGIAELALRIPDWCKHFEINTPYHIKNGYAIIENRENIIELKLEMKPCSVFANSHVARDAFKLCFMRGPIVYCAEEIDNGGELHRFSVSPEFCYEEIYNNTLSGLPELEISAFRLETDEKLYSGNLPKKTPAKLRLIPYSSFANRGESDMRVWFNSEIH